MYGGLSYFTNKNFFFKLNLLNYRTMFFTINDVAVQDFKLDFLKCPTLSFNYKW